MATIEVRNIDSPNETRSMPNGELRLVNLSGLTFGRATFQPGWKWSESVKPRAGTELCEFHHNGYVVAGRLRIQSADGTSADLGPGDVFVCEPEHDAWVLGSEPCVVFDFAGEIAAYAK